MQMFFNFDNQPKDYIPNNMFPIRPIRFVSINSDTVKPIFRGCKMVGYEWNWGDNISIEIKNQIHINIPPNSIYTYEDVDPTTSTVGEVVGQCYYNLASLKSFHLTSIKENQGIYYYIWEQDKDFTYAESGGIALDVLIPLKEGEQIVVQLFNFRKEKIRDDIYYEPEITWTLTPEESLKIVPGIYFLNVHLETMEKEEDQDVSTALRLANNYEIVVKGF